MSTAEILAELPRLSPTELAMIQARLRDLVEPTTAPRQVPKIHSPRLARPEQAKDFVKMIVELVPDAEL